jgi:hypothetical protein
MAMLDLLNIVNAIQQCWSKVIWQCWPLATLLWLYGNVCPFQHCKCYTAMLVKGFMLGPLQHCKGYMAMLGPFNTEMLYKGYMAM